MAVAGERPAAFASVSVQEIGVKLSLRGLCQAKTTIWCPVDRSIDAKWPSTDRLNASVSEASGRPGSVRGSQGVAEGVTEPRDTSRRTMADNPPMAIKTALDEALLSRFHARAVVAAGNFTDA
jgi:hypothetical protein